MEKKSTKTIVYNTKGDTERKGESKRLKKYNSKKEEFFTIDHIVRALQIQIQIQRDGTTQNVLTTATFDLKFTYVLVSWEGTAHDSRVLKNALYKQRGLKIPNGIIGLENYLIMDTSFGSDFFSFFTINV